jgi:hypothetical protein
VKFWCKEEHYFENLVKNPKKLWWSFGGILVEVSEILVPEQFRQKLLIKIKMKEKNIENLCTNFHRMRLFVSSKVTFLGRYFPRPCYLPLYVKALINRHY